MWVVHSVWLGQLIEINLPESQRVVVLEFVILLNHVLRARLNNLLIVCKRNLGFSTVRHALNSDHSSRLSQLADRALRSVLECHGSRQLQGSLLSCERAQLLGALFSCCLHAQRILSHGLVGLLGGWHELIDRILLVRLPGGDLGRKVTHFVEDLLRGEGDLWEASGLSALRLLVVVRRGHAIEDVSFVRIFLIHFLLSGSDFDRRALVWLNSTLILRLVPLESRLLDVSDCLIALVDASFLAHRVSHS